MTNNNWKNLILSVGKLHIRKLSPIEVAEHIALAEDAGFSLKEIASKCQLEGPSILSKFKNLLKIRKDYSHFIDWAEQGALVSFSIAQLVGKLDMGAQKLVLDAKMKYNLNKDEIRGINQRIERSGKTAEECVQEVIDLKQKIIIRLFIGSLHNDTIEVIKNLLQSEKDKLIQAFLTEFYPFTNIIGKIGKKDFALLVHDETLFQNISMKSLELENKINDFLNRNING